MATYYFDTHDGVQSRLDCEGIDLAGWAEAGRVAIERIKDLSREMPAAGSKVVSCTIRAVNGASARRLTMTICAQAMPSGVEVGSPLPAGATSRRAEHRVTKLMDPSLG